MGIKSPTSGTRFKSPKSLDTNSYVFPCRNGLGQFGSNDLQGKEGTSVARPDLLRYTDLGPRGPDNLVNTDNRQFVHELAVKKAGKVTM